MRTRFTHALLAFGPFGVFLIAVLDSLGVPLPAAIDLLILTISVKEPERAYFTAFMAVLGSSIGNVALFMAARHGSRWLVKSDPPSPRVRRFRLWFQRYGLLTVFVPCVTPIIPFPLKVFVVSAGVLHTGFVKFLLVVLFARCLRYFGEAWLGVSLGEHAEEFLRGHSWSLLGLALLLAAGLYLLIRRSEQVDP